MKVYPLRGITPYNPLKGINTHMRLLTCAFICAALSACSPKVVRHDVPVVVSKLVTQPCAAIRPEKPEPLPDASHWAKYDVRQKAAALGKYTIEWRNYGEALDAATAACP